MEQFYTLKFPFIFLRQTTICLTLFLGFCPILWASQEAVVISPKAVIYSDIAMTSPVGYVRRGKKIQVGEVPRNKGQVYPVIVSGKVSYIRTRDLSLFSDNIDSSRILARRFKKSVLESSRNSNLLVSYFAFNSETSLQDGSVSQNESLFWHGLSLKGEVLANKSIYGQIILNYLTASEQETTFNAVEFGIGGAYRLIEWDKFLTRFEAHLLAVPFSSYAVGNDFRVKSYGYTVGATLTGIYLVNQYWGIEAYGGPYRTSLLGFDAPEPYSNISPTFSGFRLGAGINFSY